MFQSKMLSSILHQLASSIVAFVVLFLFAYVAYFAKVGYDLSLSMSGNSISGILWTLLWGSIILLSFIAYHFWYSGQLDGKFFMQLLVYGITGTAIGIIFGLIGGGLIWAMGNSILATAIILILKPSMRI